MTFYDDIMYTVGAIEAFEKEYISFFRTFKRWARWNYGTHSIGHDGRKLRQRKHGGRFAKVNRSQRMPPMWLVRRKVI